MKLYLRTSAAFVVLLAGMFPGRSQVLGAIVTVTTNQTASSANDSVGSQAITIDSLLDLNRTNTIVASESANSVTTMLDWNGNDAYQIFDLKFDHARTGVDFSNWAATQGQLDFTANQNTTYDLSGVYTLTSGGGYLFSEVHLQNVTTATTLFHDQTTSFNVPNEQFILGDVGDGNTFNSTSGSLAGGLIAGNQYRLNFNFFIQTGFPLGEGATSTGVFRLEIGDVPQAAVPEPSSLTIFGLTSLLFAFGSHRRRARVGVSRLEPQPVPLRRC